MRQVIFYLVFLSVLGSCKSDYEKQVEKELASGVVNDSLIFGMRMGETRKQFFDTCWKLNKQKLISQGNGGASAKYIIVPDSSEDQTLKKDMYFYGIFDTTDTMRGMDMTYNYTTWAPWNKERHSDVLLKELKTFYEKHYPGNAFIEIDLDIAEYKAYAKVDGNRRIIIYPKNDKDVAVKIEDLKTKIKH